jgi:dGTPase
MSDWQKLLSDVRFDDLLNRSKPEGQPSAPKFVKRQFRLPQERDYDRILFSTPFRRMGDKTQVFPLESIESIRTRLTHSYEVANLARSLGVEIAVTLKNKLPKNALRTIPATLGAVGLAHDIGNPPFGHQGENAIRSWFERNKAVLFDPKRKTGSDEFEADVGNLTDQHKKDFLEFEGNAQTLRVLTKLQVISDDLGLNLTLGTLASVMKYIAPSNAIDKALPAYKKTGFFASEQSLVKMIREKVGLTNNARHPLALVMEACDDIAYSVLDAEDAIKKDLASFNDLIAWLKYHRDDNGNENDVIIYLCNLASWEHDKLAKQKLHPNELKDVATQKFRVHAIHILVSAVAEAFKSNYDLICAGKFFGELLNSSKGSELCKALKKFDRENAFSHRTVLEVELNGYNTINRLMDFLWMGITMRKSYQEVASDRTSPFAAYVYSRISKNYRRVFEGAVTQHHEDEKLPIRYKEMQLLTDMVSGMTDRFCIELYNDLTKNFQEIHHIS